MDACRSTRRREGAATLQPFGAGWEPASRGCDMIGMTRDARKTFVYGPGVTHAAEYDISREHAVFDKNTIGRLFGSHPPSGVRIDAFRAQTAECSGRIPPE